MTAYSDGYTDDGTDSYETLCAKGIAFGFTDSKGGTYDVFTGSTQKMNAMVQYMGYILTGHECALFMPDDGWENLKELFDEIKMAPAESYDFICADDYTEEIAAADWRIARSTRPRTAPSTPPLSPIPAMASPASAKSCLTA